MTQSNAGRPHVRELTEELVELVKKVTAFQDRAWSVYNLEDLHDKSEFAGFPVVGIAYEGCTPKDQSVSAQGNFKSAAAVAHRAQMQAAAALEFRFSIIVGIEYNPTGMARGTDDTKAVATDLVDDIRQVVLGYSGVNTRPWQLEAEAPTGSQIPGVIWYGQVWVTTIPVLSQHR